MCMRGSGQREDQNTVGVLSYVVEFMTPNQRVFPLAPPLGVSQQIQKSSMMFCKIGC